jgi:hypothetical protein
MSDDNLSDQNNISDPFKNNIKSVLLVNDPQNNLYYEAILHKEVDPDRGGECTLPIYAADQQRKCQDVNMQASSATIFQSNKKLTSGDGVIFYSEPYGWKSDARAGFKAIKNQNITLPGYETGGSALTFDYTGVARDQEYQTSCKTFLKCPGSIKIQGNYLVGLYTGNQTSNSGGSSCTSTTPCDCGAGFAPSIGCCEGCNGAQSCLCDDGTYSMDCCASNKTATYYCQIFKKDVPDLGKEEFLASGAGKSLDTILIIPTK